jgi:hypothetical protein
VQMGVEDRRSRLGKHRQAEEHQAQEGKGAHGRLLSTTG